MNLKIIYEDNHLIIVEKPPNIPVQRDESKDLDLLTMVKQYIKKKHQKPGNVYIGLVHRLDRPVGGVMVFARTSKAASRLSEMIRNQEFHKTYLAVVHGQLENKTGSLENYLLKNNQINKSKIVNSEMKGSKLAVLSYRVIKYDSISDLSLVEINLQTGRHHQIRVQFSHINHPILGDQRYGKKSDKGLPIYLWAKEISFTHPVNKQTVKFKCIPSWFTLH
ncbi:MAG: RluA family pseudouridine synthase [Bacilli bacterium]|jgi:23S rRNA pseudouridine1911/1915/1917 synthase|nr:RluA family pseudouridine synthase [Bacilli bacterium]